MAKASHSSFNYTVALRDLCANVVANVRELSHIQINRVGFSIAEARKNSRYGGWASMTPLRFEGGALVQAQETRRRAFVPALNKFQYVKETRYYRPPEVIGADGATRLLYIFSIVTPRFYDLSFAEKIDTIMHELYHISPYFNGDVRRFPGRNWQHGNKDRYDAIARRLGEKWLDSNPDEKLYDFLNLNYSELCETYGSIRCSKYARVKLYEITREEARKLQPDLFESSARS